LEDLVELLKVVVAVVVDDDVAVVVAAAAVKLIKVAGHALEGHSLVEEQLVNFEIVVELVDVLQQFAAVDELLVEAQIKDLLELNLDLVGLKLQVLP
jgi:hypothetical protein